MSLIKPVIELVEVSTGIPNPLKIAGAEKFLPLRCRYSLVSQFFERGFMELKDGHDVELKYVTLNLIQAHTDTPRFVSQTTLSIQQCKLTRLIWQA